MGFFDDILKGLPANATLREKNADLQSENASLETEVAILKDQLREAKGEIAKLEQQIKEQTHIDLSENDLLILKTLWDLSSPTQSPSIAQLSGLELQYAKYHLQILTEAKYVRCSSGYMYSLEQKGREYLIKNKLV